MLIPIVSVPLGVVLLTLRDPTLDPSYLWFRHKIYGNGIIFFIIILLILGRLETISKGGNMRPSKFGNHIRNHRQLQIISVIANRLVRFVLPQTILMFLVAVVMMGYMLIKMSRILHHAVIIIDVVVIIAITGYVQLGFGLIADVDKKSDKFLKGLGRDCGKCEKRELRSCKELRVWAGSYFAMTKTTRIKLFDMMAYYTMSLVISV
ncbi:hypothetical protein Fcan01_24201 [Folsomia candida]|uniref:Uncharacterized protein n=1 Tax=Folsomia candida TaxID=158441 RepID=A0A226D803_FOLCA|nr:hypothetical protein Fcan01_24201 [Folsomia candida]